MPMTSPLLDRLLALWQAGTPPAAVVLGAPANAGKHALAERLMARILQVEVEHIVSHPDLVQLTPEVGSSAIKADQVRIATTRLRLAPAAGDRRFLVVRYADDLTDQAADALLKTLEEPPSAAHVLLLAHQPWRLRATLRSRCQVFQAKPEDFPKPAGATIPARLLALAGGWPASAAALHAAGAEAILEGAAELLADAGGGSGLDRRAVQRWIDQIDGKNKERLELALTLVPRLLARIAEAAATHTPASGSDEAEQRAAALLAARGGAARLLASLPAVEAMVGDVALLKTEARYTLARVLGAFEHALKGAGT